MDGLSKNDSKLKNDPKLKHNPYVGSFIYSPSSEPILQPLSSAEIIYFKENQETLQNDMLSMFKNHPILGFFRHSQQTRKDQCTQTDFDTQTKTKDVGTQVDLGTDDFIVVTVQNKQNLT